MDNDAVLNCNDLGWISFMYLLGSSSVVKSHVLSDYLDIGEPDYKYWFNCNMTPRIIHILKKCFWYFIAIKKLLLLLYLENFNQILFYHCYLQSPPPPQKYIYIYIIQVILVQLQKILLEATKMVMKLLKMKSRI